MKYLLDTAILVALLRGRAGAIARLATRIANQEAVTSVVCYAEVIERFYPLPQFAQNVAATRRLLQRVRPLPFSYAAMERYALIRQTLRPLGQLIGDVDTLIAAVALEQHVTIVTVDNDFRRVPGLSLEILTRDEVFNAP